MGVIPPDANAGFVAGLEDVLEVYQRPRDPTRPVVCLDETTKQLVAALEATDVVGTMGRIKFYGRKDRFTHAMEYGPNAVQGAFIQWQQGKMETIWPLTFATTKILYPSLVKLPA